MRKERALDLTWVYEGLSCGVLLHDGEGTVVEANDAAARMTGLTRAQLLGREPPDPDWRAVGEGGEVLPGLFALARGAPRRSRVQVRRGGDVVPVWIRADSATADASHAPFRVVSTLVDVTDERTAGPRLGHPGEDAARRLERLQAVRSAAVAMNAGHDLQVTLDVIVQQAVIGLGVSAAAVALVGGAEPALEYAAGAGFRKAEISRSRLALGEGYLGRAALERRVLRVDDLSLASEFVRRELVSVEGFVAYMAMPLIARGHLAGVLELFHRDQLQLDSEWFALAEILAEEAATAIDNHRLRVQPGPSQLVPAQSPLTPTQTEILRMLATGRTNHGIAERVFLSPNTVKFHLRQIYRRLGVHTRTEAVVAATNRGWM